MGRGSAAEAVTIAQPDPATLALHGALTFATVAGALVAARRALSGGTATQLDLAGVTRVDSAGLACMLALAAEVSRKGQVLQIRNWPEGLPELAAVCGVTELLGAPRVVA